MKRGDFYGFMAAKDNDVLWLTFIQSWYKADCEIGDGQRDGQRIMNALYGLRVDLYHFATATPFDPFYRDGLLREFGDNIYEEWVKRYVLDN